MKEEHYEKSFLSTHIPNHFIRSLKFLLLCSLICSCFFTKANDCSLRYLDTQFDSVKVQHVAYDVQENYLNEPDTLYSWILSPVGDDAKQKPMLIYVHGGAMLQAEEASYNIFYLCKTMAQKGYVVAYVEYRMGDLDNTSVELGKRVTRAIQDVNSFVRYTKANAQAWEVDTNLMFLSGNSAGSIACLYQQYVNESAYPDYMKNLDIGGAQGYGNLNGHNTKVAGVFNMWGIINDTNWIKKGATPIGSIQSIDDPCVPFDYSKYSCAYFSLPAYGAHAIYQRAQHLGIYSTVYGIPSDIHNIGIDSSEYLDTTIEQLSLFCAHVIRTKLHRPDPSLLRVCENPIGVLNVQGDGSGDFYLRDEKGKELLNGKMNAPLDISSLAGGTYTVMRSWKRERLSITFIKR